MGKLAIAAALILLGGPESERDVVWLKDRPDRPVEGIIVEENDQEIKLLKLFKGEKGQTSGTAAVKFRKSRIAKIDRMTAATRRRLIRKYEGFRDRRSRMAEALEKIKTRRVSLMGKTALQTFGTHFRVVSTCEEAFVKEVTYYLDEVFAAYKESFAIQRNADRRIDVYVLSDMEEYTGFLKGKLGYALENPALYSPRRNFIAACNMIQKEEAARIRKAILAVEREIQEWKKKVADRETEVRREVLEFKRKVRAEAAAARRRARGDAGLLRKIAQWEREELGRGEKWERENKKGLDALREEADEAIEHNRTIAARNRRILLDQNKRMFEALFHEGFHAFAQNFLWMRGTEIAVPRWLNEGLASYYEMSAVDAGELVHGAPHPGLLALVRQARHKGELLPIETILRGDAGKFLVQHGSQAHRSNLYYAQSWALAHYMVERVSRKRMQAYVLALLAGSDKVRAFEQMMGANVRHVEAKVKHHVAGLE